MSMTIEEVKEWLKTPEGKLNVKESKRGWARMYRLQKIKNNHKLFIMERLRSRFNQAIRNYTIYGKIKSIDKYNLCYADIIEKLFPLPFPIEDRKMWHIDHIRPLSSFDLDNEDEVRRAFSPENLQWLPAHDNLSKGKKYIDTGYYPF